MKRSMLLVMVGVLGLAAGMLVRPAEANREERALAIEILCRRFVAHVKPLIDDEWARQRVKPPLPDHERAKSQAIVSSLIAVQIMVCR